MRASDKDLPVPEAADDEFMTYADLITEALNDASKGVLTLSGIYKSINARHPQYKMEDSNWQTCIRNNLSINKSFRKEKKYWKIAPDLGYYDKPNMTYAQLITETLNNSWGQTLVLSDIYKAINAKYPYYKLETPGWQNSIRHVLTVKENRLYIKSFCCLTLSKTVLLFKMWTKVLFSIKANN